MAPDQLLEAFTMSFTYDGAVPRVKIATSTSAETGSAVDLGRAQEGLRNLIAQVMVNTQNIGGRSSKCKVSIFLRLLFQSKVRFRRPQGEYAIGL